MYVSKHTAACRQPFVNRASIGSGHEMQTLAVLALHELLDDPDRNDWDELVAATRTVIQAIETGEPMLGRNARIVAEYLREAGWQEYAIRSATVQAGAHAEWPSGAALRAPAQ
jgi:hypothetical protein